MSIGRTRAVALLGIQGSLVEIEADIANGLPGLILIGLPDASLAEARDRVRAAAVNSGCPLSTRKLTINLSPASLPKHGAIFDLAIAIACLAAAGDVRAASAESVVHLGELGLDGRLRPTIGILPAVVAAVGEGHTRVMVPAGNAAEAALVPNVEVIPVASLREAAIWHGARCTPVEVEPIVASTPDERGPAEPDLCEIIGNEEAIDAMIVAAAGGHHMFILGPPGAGKTMLVSRLPGILPDLDDGAALEATSMLSLAGGRIGSKLVRRPPIEAPHHTATAAAMLGGGSGRIRPGSAARASHGVLFLDEAPEFASSVLDVLRQPLESGTITINRANGVAVFPGSFQLVLAANPCPCGQYGARDAECTCSPTVRRRYLARVSGPLLDRIDIQLWLRRVTSVHRVVESAAPRMSSAEARVRVEEARRAARERHAGSPWRLNSEVPGSWLRGPSGSLGRAATGGIDRALERGNLTMRGYDRVLRLAWTLSDLDASSRPSADHVGKALFLRRGIAA